MPRVRFEREGEDPVELDVGFGSNLFRAAFGRSVSLFNGPMKVLHCWGKGSCGACFVEVVSGAEALAERTDVEKKKLRDAAEDVRLACQLRVRGDLVVRKPPGWLRPRPAKRRPVEETPARAGSAA